MNNDFDIKGSPEILKLLKINVLYMDDAESPLRTYYDKGEVHRYEGAARGYVVYVNYDDALFFRAYCDRNPEYFDYSTSKSVTVEPRGGALYANVVFLKDQEEQERRYDSSTQMLPLKDAIAKYQSDFHPVTWPKRLSLEDKLRLTSPP